MKSIITKTYIALLICSLFSSVSYAQWQIIGPESSSVPTGISESSAEYVDLAISPSRTPYIAFKDWISTTSADKKASVMKYNGTSWEYVGSRGISAGEVFFTNITIAPDGTPYIIYSDGFYSTKKAVVKKFDGTNWVMVGDTASSTQADYTMIITDATGVPYILYRGPSTTFYSIIKKYDSGTNTWVLMTLSTGINAFTTDVPSIAFNGLGELFWAGKDASRSSMRKYPGNNTAVWNKVQNGGNNNSNITPGANGATLAFDKNNVPYLFFKENTSMVPNQAQVWKYTGVPNTTATPFGWEAVGPKNFSAGAIDNFSITFDNKNIPMVAYREGGASGKAVVRKYNSGTNTWDYVQLNGVNALSTGIGSYPFITRDNRGNPYVAYADANISTKAVVLKYLTPVPVTISSTATGPTNLNPIPVKIDFDSVVTGFVLSDITVTGGTASNLAGSGKNYTVDITPSADDTIKVNVAANVAEGLDGPNKAATQFKIKYDGTSPTVSIASVLFSPTSVNPIPLTLDFSEIVTGFDISDISVLGGTASNFAGSGKNYTVDIIPSGDGTIKIDVAGSSANDIAGNGNTAASQFSIDFSTVPSDITPPSVSISSTAGTTTQIKPIPVAVEFSEDVLGFIISDITVTGGTASNFAGSGKSYTVNITPTSDGNITVDINAGVAKDLANNNNTAATQFSIFYCIVPSISAQPTNKEICVASNTSFAVSGTGTSLTYQWQVNTGSGFTDVNDNAIYSNATTNTLTITGATVDMNGYIYHCIISGACAPSATSNNATLTIKASPSINTHPSNKAICLGSTSFHVVASGPGLTYQWQVDNGTGFSNITDNAIYSGSTTDNLAVTNPPSTMHNYKFQVVVSGACSPNVTSNAANLSLGTIFAPTVSAPSMQCGPGQVTLVASGNVDGNYRWYETATGGSPIANNTASIFITPLLKENRKYYASIREGDCESERTEIQAVISAKPAQPLFGFSYGNRLTSSSNIGNQWLLNNVEIPGAVDKVFYASEAGIYAVRVTVNGCSNTSKERYVAVTGSVLGSVTADDDPIISNGSVKVYPNPAREKIFVKYDPIGMSKEVKAYLYTFQGKLLKEKVITNSSNWETVFELNSYSKGNYFIRISNGKSNVSKPFILK